MHQQRPQGNTSCKSPGWHFLAWKFGLSSAYRESTTPCASFAVILILSLSHSATHLSRWNLYKCCRNVPVAVDVENCECDSLGSALCILLHKGVKPPIATK